jgi:ribosomal peptide maturation radical SAM protein 1
LTAALVNMPFASAARPSIQVGLLTAVAGEAGYPVEGRYPNLELAAELGVEVYEQLCEHRGHMTGDWLFARAAFGEDLTGDAAGYLAEFPAEAEWERGLGRGPGYLVELRERVLPGYVRRIAAAEDWGRFQLIGFTSTFQQTTAALALARAIKQAHPGVPLVFGGANVDGTMGAEMLRAFPWVDLVVSGDGDAAFPALLRAVEAGTEPAAIPGVLTRRDGAVRGRQAPPFQALDRLPPPDYGSYFAEAERLGLLGRLAPAMRLPFEGSRGCWWGAKHHCTFCGLNGEGMGYRSKRPDRVLRELGELSARHATTSFEAVDNILDVRYLESVFLPITEAKLDFRFFYEVKANLTRERIRTLAHGGATEVQPGIESLSTHVLKLMRKGSTMLQNVLCLKWCTYYGVAVAWNLLHGFPGEREEDYLEQLAVVDAIGHLPPPTGFNRIWLERFSPYFAEAGAFGVTGVRPRASYAHVYPDGAALDELAYFFDYDMRGAIAEPDGGPPNPVLERTRARVGAWREAWDAGRRPVLSFRQTPDELFVDRVSEAGERRTIALHGEPREMLLHCTETIRSTRAVCEHLAAVTGRAYAEEEVRGALDGFCDARLMVGEGGRFLGLPLPASPHW